MLTNSRATGSRMQRNTLKLYATFIKRNRAYLTTLGYLAGPGPLRLSDGNKPNLETFAERLRYAEQHHEGVSFVVGVLQTTNHGRGSADLLRQGPMAKPRFGAEVVDLGCHLGIEQRLFEKFLVLRVARDEAVVGVLQRLRIKPSFRRHFAIFLSGRMNA